MVAVPMDVPFIVKVTMPVGKAPLLYRLKATSALSADCVRVKASPLVGQIVPIVTGALVMVTDWVVLDAL